MSDDPIARAEALIDRLERTALPPSALEDVRGVVRAVMELHAAGLQRVLSIVRDAGEPGAVIERRLASDSLVASVLALHDLHPDDPATRVAAALEEARQRIERTGGRAAITAVADGAVRVELESGDAQLAGWLEAHLADVAPDVTIELDVVTPPLGFVPLERLRVEGERG